MEGDRRSIRLDVWLDGGSPSGRATAGDGAARGFAGWLGLMAAVEALADERPASEEAPASEHEEGNDD